MLKPDERNVGLTVNEYETLLMQNDLADVLRDPLRFARLKARHVLNDPLAVPGKTLNYAKYDVVHMLNRYFNQVGEPVLANGGHIDRYNGSGLLAFFGADTGVFASDAPFDPEKGPMYLRETIRIIDELEISEEDRAKIYYRNAEKLLGLAA